LPTTVFANLGQACVAPTALRIILGSFPRPSGLG
jgi:hypothetical protein